MLLPKTVKFLLCFLLILYGIYWSFSIKPGPKHVRKKGCDLQESTHEIISTERPSICMMLPVTSRGVTYNASRGLLISDLPLVHSFLPSLLRTVEDKYIYRLYVGYDYGDPWYDNSSNWDQVLNLFHNYVRQTNHPRLQIHIYPNILYGIDQRITAIWNTLASIAYNDLCDYFYPANDDLRIETKGWTSEAIRTLQRCPVAANFGVVAFRDLNACRFPTFHLTHRTHLDLHDGIYYPLPSHGAYQDPWIFGMYRAWNCAFFLPQYELRNHIGISVTARYDYGKGQLVEWIQRARRELHKRLLTTCSSLYSRQYAKFFNLSLNLNWEVPC